jgi:glycosyltransferase involved in cell wall biosynthesis
MRVVYVSSIPAGGPLSHVLDLAPRVAQSGVEVTVLCTNEEIAGRFRDAGVSAHALPLRHMFDLPGATRIRRELRGADVVHTHDRRAGLLARPAARLSGVISVHTLHGLPEGFEPFVGRDDLRLPLGPALLRLRAEAVLSRLGTIVAPSAAMARVLISNGFREHRLRVIPYGMTRRRSDPPPPRSPVVVGTAANLESHKAIGVLIDAFALVDAPASLEIFGDGSQRAELERRATELGVPARFHGWVADMRSRLEEIDLFVLPTRGDNLPVSILEAMSLALPVVSTRVGGIPELIVDGVTGLIVEPGDREGLAGAIEKLVRDPDLRARFGRAGADRVDQQFDSDRIAQRMVGLYDELVRARGA